MALLNNQVIDFVCWVTGNSRETVEGQLKIWLSEQRSPTKKGKQSVPDEIKVKLPDTELSGKENRYRYLSEKLQNQAANMTVAELADIMTELQNLEYDLK
jgi:hypothetical protein